MPAVTVSQLLVFQGLFGNTAASQAGGLFGAAQTSTATGFGTGTGLFGQPNTGFGNLGTQVVTTVHTPPLCAAKQIALHGRKTFERRMMNVDKFRECKRVISIFVCVCVLQQSLFGNKTAGFGTTTTSAPSFGTGTGLFGNKPALTLGTGTNTSSFGTAWSSI